MRTFIKISLIVLMALALVASTPARTKLPDAPKYATIYNVPPVDFKFMRTGDKKSPDYRFVGVLKFPDQILDVKKVVVVSMADSVALTCTFIDRTLTLYEDGCQENFTFGVHGGSLRKQLEKSGEIVIFVFGREHGIRLGLTEGGKESVLKVIVKFKQEPI